jgi:hypothetical protein
MFCCRVFLVNSSNVTMKMSMPHRLMADSRRHYRWLTSNREDKNEILWHCPEVVQGTYSESTTCDDTEFRPPEYSSDKPISLLPGPDLRMGCWFPARVQISMLVRFTPRRSALRGVL